MIFKTKRSLSALLAVLICLPIIACTPKGGEAGSTDPLTSSEPTVTASAVTEAGSQPVGDPNVRKLSACATSVKRVGRTTVLSGITCDFTASGIEFEATVTGDLKIKVQTTGKEVYYTVFVDGVRLEERFRTKVGIDTITVGGFTGGRHQIRVLRQTEAQSSKSVLLELEFEGELIGPMADRELYIEFLGDSITCGYGNLIYGNPTDGSGAGDPIHQDGTAGYAFLAAEALGADYSIVSCSGIGVQNGYTSFPMSKFYRAESFFRDRIKDYDFSRARVPELVVINLGTNDQNKGSTEQGFKDGVRELVQTVWQNYGEDTPILWVYGMMNAGRIDWTREVFADMGGEAKGLYTVELPRNTGGAAGHPTAEAHETAADMLAERIRTILGLK